LCIGHILLIPPHSVHFSLSQFIEFLLSFLQLTHQPKNIDPSFAGSAPKISIILRNASFGSGLACTGKLVKACGLGGLSKDHSKLTNPLFNLAFIESNAN